MGIFGAFLVPLPEADSQQRVMSKSLVHEEEHLPGPIDKTPDAVARSAVVVHLSAHSTEHMIVGVHFCGLSPREPLRPQW